MNYNNKKFLSIQYFYSEFQLLSNMNMSKRDGQTKAHKPVNQNGFKIAKKY